MTDARCGVRSNPVPAFLELPAATGGNTHTHPSHHQSGRSPAPAAFFFRPIFAAAPSPRGYGTHEREKEPLPALRHHQR